MPLPRRAHHQNCTTDGDLASCFVGADASVRPIGNYDFAATFHKNGGAFCRADRVVRPYRICVVTENACNFAIACCRGERGIDPYAK